MGNICRSPTAHAVLIKTLKLNNMTVRVDSAGTIEHHKGSRPDQRSMMVAQQRGYDFKGIKSRPITDSDFEKFDLILAMDNHNLLSLQAKCPPHYYSKLHLLLNYADGDITEVPDPYYGGSKGFDLVLDLIEASMPGLIAEIKREM